VHETVITPQAAGRFRAAKTFTIARYFRMQGRTTIPPFQLRQ
jgi:hypothetical protein